MTKDSSLNEKSDMDVNISGGNSEPDVGVSRSNKPYIDPAEERKLLRKVDGFLIGILGMLYLLAFLDRGNIGNANVAGLSTDLKLKGNQYGTIVSIVYATYVVFEPVWANLLKIITPRILLSVSTLCWGVLTLSTAWATSYDHMIAIRVLLGVTEAGLFPCLNLVLAMNYRPEELARRLSYVFSAAALSGAFGGLLAYGLTQISGGIFKHRWGYLYFVEGLISIAFAPIAYFMVPNHLTEAWFLNKREKELCAVRYEINKENYDPSEKFSWHEVKRGFTDWKTWAHAVNQFCVDISLYGVTTFMPTIIKGLNITKKTVDAQLLTVPVYFVAAASFIIGAKISDHYKNRSVPLLVYGAIMIIGYIIIATVHSPQVRYFGVFVTGLGTYSMSALNVAWTNNNNAKHYKRATATGLMQLVGNSSGACIGYIYNAQSAPGYHKGLWISVGLTALSMVITATQAMALKRINEKRRVLVAQGAEDQPELGDENPHFVFYL
ncbi:MFS general substrate transporter [Meredithblackwellia eburnea MCA 4105]